MSYSHVDIMKKISSGIKKWEMKQKYPSIQEMRKHASDEIMPDGMMKPSNEMIESAQECKISNELCLNDKLQENGGKLLNKRNLSEETKPDIQAEAKCVVANGCMEEDLPKSRELLNGISTELEIFEERFETRDKNDLPVPGGDGVYLPCGELLGSRILFEVNNKRQKDVEDWSAGVQ